MGKHIDIMGIYHGRIFRSNSVLSQAVLSCWGSCPCSVPELDFVGLCWVVSHTWRSQVAALRKEAAKWQELEESKLFLETQVAQFQSAKQQEASRADTLAAQVIHPP